MKKEEISNMINNIDDGFIAEAASYTEENSDKNKIVKKHRFFKTGSGMVAAIAVCVLLLGGITVYAFNHVAIKEFLFGKADDETFEESESSKPKFKKSVDLSKFDGDSLSEEELAEKERKAQELAEKKRRIIEGTNFDNSLRKD